MADYPGRSRSGDCRHTGPGAAPVQPDQPELDAEGEAADREHPAYVDSPHDVRGRRRPPVTAVSVHVEGERSTRSHRRCHGGHSVSPTLRSHVRRRALVGARRAEIGRRQARRRSATMAVHALAAMPAIVHVRESPSMCSLRTSSVTVSSSVVVSVPKRTRSTGRPSSPPREPPRSARLHARSSEMSGPDVAAPALASVTGSVSITARSRCTGTEIVSCSVVTYFRNRARPASRVRVPT